MIGQIFLSFVYLACFIIAAFTTGISFDNGCFFQTILCIVLVFVCLFCTVFTILDTVKKHSKKNQS
jgi:uncharacterized ion transporter superfamily protein YfcC